MDCPSPGSFFLSCEFRGGLGLAIALRGIKFFDPRFVMEIKASPDQQLNQKRNERKAHNGSERDGEPFEIKAGAEQGDKGEQYVDQAGIWELDLFIVIEQ